MIKPEINKLYIYKPAEINTISIFTHNLLWASNPKHFNDPYDCQLSVNNDITPAQFIQITERINGPKERWPIDLKHFVWDRVLNEAKEFQSDAKEKLLQSLKRKVENKGVICLSEKADDILMWSHYASKHKGICIELDRSPGTVLADDWQCQPVDYKDEYPVYNMHELLDKRDYEIVQLLIRTKSSHWSYEHEWRLFTEVGDKYCPKMPGNITRVVFGVRSEPTFKEAVRRLCDPSVEFTLAKMSSNKFKIEC